MKVNRQSFPTHEPAHHDFIEFTDNFASLRFPKFDPFRGPSQQCSLRVHSLRKFFKTNLLTKGIPEPIVDYMMGHVTDTYTDIQSQEVEHQRHLYSSEALSIHPRIEDSLLINSLIQQLKAAGRDPEKYLRKEALSEPRRIVASGQYSQEEQARALLAALRDYVTGGLAARS